MNFLLSYRSMPHSTTNTTPSELFLHRSLRTRLDLLRPELGVAVSQKQAEQKKYHDLHSRNRNFFIGERVLVRNMRNDPHWLLGTIVERRGPLSYLVQVANGVVWKRHVDHLRKTIDSPQEEVTVPEIIDESPTASPLQDPPAVYSNEGGTVVPPPNDSVLVIQKDQRLLTLPVEEPVTDTTPLPPQRYSQRVRRPPERFHEQYM